MDMLASLFAANYAFYSNIQGRQPMFYSSPASYYPSQVVHLLNQPRTSSSSSPTNRMMSFSSSSSSSVAAEKKSDSEEGESKKDKNVKFSIDSILQERKPSSDTEEDENPFSNNDDSLRGGDEDEEQGGQFSWLQCTRYKPPKLPRLKKKDGSKKRKLGRNPRVPFTQHQVSSLEHKFRQTHYLSSMDVAELSTALNLTETRVKIWFQNRRARERRDREATQRGHTTHHKLHGFSSVPITGSPWTFPIQSSNHVLAHYRDMVQVKSSAFTPVTLPRSTCS